ncbi:two-component hybrid sensor and regulator (modular protein) (plasmid) [Azospirillum sp. TSH58]|uniref:hybrid sensor histidine kinase/response regulator n=1 Tax=Azospirillum sp. TSH58 TaxID=664962 RepID=UPI000D600DC9|nr:ATP-binding protein [Azospirillum sp. TSH58]AWJ87700.1 two-component hybrid sensor and regulator (modular protein) [Azospirillum sp. TSH58]
MPHYLRLFLLIVAAVVPLAALQFMTQHSLRQDRENEMRNDTLRLLDLLDAEQQRIAAEARQVLATIVESGVPQAGPPSCQETMDRLRARYPAYLSVEVADRQGRVWCATDLVSLGVDLGGIRTFQSALATGALTTGEYGLRYPNQRPILPFRLAYPAPDGTPDAPPGGVVTVLLDARWLEENLGHRPLPPGMEMVIADRQGHVVARLPEAPDAIGQPLPTAMLQAMHAARGTRSVAVFDSGGAERMVVSAPLDTGTRESTIAIGIDRDAALRPVRDAMVFSLALFGGVLLLTCLGAAWGMRKFLRVRDRMLETVVEKASVLESTTDAVAELDRSWRVVFVNERARALLPDSGSVVGRNGRQAFAELMAGESGRTLQQAMEHREAVEFETQGPRSGVWFAVRAFPSRKGLALYFRDATERRRLEDERTLLTRQLEAERSLLTAILDHLPSGLLVAEAPSGRIVKVNDTALRLLGGPPPPAAGCGCDGTRACSGGACFGDGRCPLSRALLKGEAVEQEDLPYTRPDGTAMTLSVSATPVHDADGRVTLAICTLRDVGERKAMERALQRAKEEADEANRAKSKFLAAASHDLRQPMQSMFLFTGILHRFISDEQGQRSLEMLERGLDTLKGLLDSLLDVSRLDAGAVDPRVEPFALNSLLDEIAASYAPILESKNLAFRIVLDQAATVLSDRVLLGRMVRNLLENAVKYTERGAVQIAVRPQDGRTPGGGTSPPRVRIEVSDTGIGIPPDQLTRIFTEFHQINNPERDRARGLGLGLAIVQRLSAILDHPVEVKSQPGRGSVFAITVPLAAVEAAPVPPPMTASAFTGGSEAPRALLVDDDAIVLLGLRDMFREWGYEVRIAGSTDEAVAKIQADGRMPDVMLVDYRLREGRVGTEAVVRVRAMAGWDVPAMILTGEAGPECETDAAAHGLEVVRKPVTPRQLRRVLERAMAKQAKTADAMTGAEGEPFPL